MSHQEALLYVFEDNEAVIKMIIKGRSPTMGHVSRTHRVALDWLFDRINLDPKIQIKYFDTKKCLENACMHDVHIIGPLPPTQHNHKGLALCSRCHPAWASEGTPVGPGKDSHGTLGPEQRGGRGWPTPTPKGRSAHAITRTQDSPTHKVFRQTW